MASNAYWTGSEYDYVNPAGWAGSASRIFQSAGAIEFDTTSGGTNPITWNQRLLIGNNGNIAIGGAPLTGGKLNLLGGAIAFANTASVGTGLLYNDGGLHLSADSTLNGDIFLSGSAGVSIRNSATGATSTIFSTTAEIQPSMRRAASSPSAALPTRPPAGSRCMAPRVRKCSSPPRAYGTALASTRAALTSWVIRSKVMAVTTRAYSRQATASSIFSPTAPSP